MEIMSLAKKIVKVIKERYSPDGYSIMQDGGIFNDIGHYHLHIFPRYKNDEFRWNFGDIKHKVSSSIAHKLGELLIK